MNELINITENQMTVREVAEVLGVSIQLIRKRIREMLPTKMVHGVTTYLNEAEVTVISIRLKENSSLITANQSMNNIQSLLNGGI